LRSSSGVAKGSPGLRPVWWVSKASDKSRDGSGESATVLVYPNGGWCVAVAPRVNDLAASAQRSMAHRWRNMNYRCQRSYSLGRLAST
jgi:hypothetical protein